MGGVLSVTAGARPVCAVTRASSASWGRTGLMWHARVHSVMPARRGQHRDWLWMSCRAGARGVERCRCEGSLVSWQGDKATRLGERSWFGKVGIASIGGCYGLLGSFDDSDFFISKMESGSLGPHGRSREQIHLRKEPSFWTENARSFGEKVRPDIHYGRTCHTYQPVTWYVPSHLDVRRFPF